MEISLPCAASDKICNLSRHVRVCVAFLPFEMNKQTNNCKCKLALKENNCGTFWDKKLL